MIDAHCHLDDWSFDADRAEALARARAAGVEGIVLAGVAPDQWERASALAAAEPGIVAAYGVHPHTAARATDAEADALVADLAARLAAGSLARARAVGELGLDRSRHVPGGSLARQERAFRAQLALARERDLPVVLHLVRAHGRALEILQADGLPAAGGLVHAFTGSPEVAARYVALGLHVSFGGAVTWPEARRARASAAAVPDERLLAETDAPDFTPEDRKPARNEPAFLASVVRGLAALRGATPEHVAAVTTANARRLLDWS